MPRADLLLDLVEAECRGDRARFRVLVEAVIAEERANQHHLLGDRLAELITTTGQGKVRDDRAAAIHNLVQEVIPETGNYGDLLCRDLNPETREISPIREISMSRA